MFYLLFRVLKIYIKMYINCIKNVQLGKNIDFSIWIDSYFYETISILKSQ